MLNKKMLSYKTRSFIKKNNAKRISTDYKDAESIGILFSIDGKQKHQIVKEFKKILEKDGKQVKVLAYLPKDQENFEFLFDFFTNNDVNFWGSFTSDQVQSFVDKTFDYLFYLDIETNDLTQNILAMSKAKCRVGKYNEKGDSFFELMINTHDSNVKGLADEMYKYTKILN
ncbi:DUF6913 domain-containing protein [Fulvivirga ligni]|uniref:DUF6913 domain-containing protein n=1 Tax=Fulvivirga ligni TaxID=2904246 RepID=UPI001F47D776|nr:hypothetical protein [Fulvivirga ligni]UII24205.1 hypothetical protein LVD16_13365 [Fulvivirga ligni]